MFTNLQTYLRALAILLLSQSLFLQAYGSGPVPTHIFQDDVQEKIDFSDSLSIFIDQNRAYDIYQIINMPELEFARPPKELNITPPFIVWSKIVLKNNGTTARNEYFSFCMHADSLWMYAVENGAIMDEKIAGSALGHSDKSLPSFYNYLPISIDAGKTKTYIFKTSFRDIVEPAHLAHLHIQPGQPLIQRLFGQYLWNSFYAGVMLLFCMVSIFMFSIFREKIFLYFGALMFFFAFYFMDINNIVDAFFINTYKFTLIDFGQLFISGIVLSVFLFVSGYIQLKTVFPKYYKVYLFFSLIVAPYAHILLLLGQDKKMITISHNVILLIWIILTMVPIIRLAWKKDKAAKILLTSIGILFLGAFFFIISFQNVNPSNDWMRYGFQIGSVVFSGVLFYGLFDKINIMRNEKQRMEELDQLKSRFFANISHEFRTPLTLMMGPIERVMENTDDPINKELLDMAHRNANRQLQLVNQLLDLSKLESGKMDLQASEEDFIPFIKGMVHVHESLAVQKNIGLKITCPDGELPLYFNRDKMEKIFYNLLSNAFKFTPSGGKISVVLKKKNEKAIVAISDTGIGISQEKLPDIFDRFFQADFGKNDVQEGSGIGLALVKEFVELHGGTIEVESKKGKGTTFYMEFQFGKNHLQPQDIAREISEQMSANFSENGLLSTAPVLTENNNSVKSKAPKYAPHLLVIEDNDDVRAFIRLRLENTFYLTEAKDGQDGILKAIELMPNLIISDVMMPKKDGYEVCQILKKDIRTSHIPIILLTAKAAQEEKIEGLETGADDYLTKPFDSKELEIRVQNLIRLRQQLRERFAGSISLKPSEVVTNSIDKEFLENAMQAVEANMGNEQFTIEILAQEIGMSRPNLNRKLRALLNQSTNQFIQSVRLQRAADLLRQQAGTVSEIAFQTGFGSAAYFVKCFKDQFGETPGNYLKRE